MREAKNFCGLDTKVVFLVCYNTSHPPKTERIKHPKNALLLFAPISRTFAESFPNGYRVTEIPEYKTNGFDLIYGKTASVDANLSYLHAWKQVYEGDVADFDYHLMWDHILDAGGEGIAKVICNDLKNFDSLGMNGFISCQLQRNAFPTSIAMTTMAKVLWDNGADFDAIRRELYAASFGDCTDELCEYFELLSRALDVGAIRGQRVVDRGEFREKMERAVSAMETIAPIIEAHLNVSDPCHKESWEILELHRRAYSLIGKAILSKLAYDEYTAEKLIEEAHMLVWENEDKLQSVLVSMYFYRMTGERITVNEVSAFTVI